MTTHAIRHIPVIDEGQLVGVVGEGELRIAEALPSVDTRALELSRIMTTPLCVQSETLLDEVSALMSADKAECVVVLGPDGVRGIFTAVDALRALQDLIERA